MDECKQIKFDGEIIMIYASCLLMSSNPSVMAKKVLECPSWIRWISKTMTAPCSHGDDLSLCGVDGKIGEYYANHSHQ